MRTFISFTTGLMLAAATCFAQAKDYTRYVNPFIGTGGHGHTYPGPSMPFGMMQLSPDTRLTGWDGCSGYHYSDSVVYGFSHTHLSGTGIPDYCDILLMPTVGQPQFNNQQYASPFRKANEKASVGYYATKLDKYGINVELTATRRVGLHQYTFPATSAANIIVDLQHRDEVIESWIEVVSNTEIRGFRRSKAWAKDQPIYFYARFSKPFKTSGIALNDVVQPDLRRGEGKNVKLYLQFNTRAGERVLAKVATSAVSAEGALKNMEAELKGFDFNGTKAAAQKAWNKELAQIDAEGGDNNQLTNFYTALYHAKLNPNLFMDADGKYLGLDKQVHQADGFECYTVFSLWDTYRTEHPLLTLIDRKHTLDFIKTFLAMYDQGKLLPIWELASNETYCMIGNHSIPVIVDAYAKGIREFDTEKALQAMKDAVNRKQYGIDVFNKYGAVMADKESESVSKTVEYAYDDWCIAQFAKMLGKTEDYKEYIRRSQYWKNLFDATTNFITPKLNGGFLRPFNPTEVNNNFTEGNAWHYNFSVQQDVNTEMELMGGEAAYERKLDELFTTGDKLSGREQVDITGLIGQYAHGNEPSHHMSYLFDFTSHPEKTQYYLHQIFDHQYHNAPDGLSGNEDCGQMSAWLVMSAMGFYPVSPGNNMYVAGSPMFRKMTVHLENGKELVINAPGLTKTNIYTSSLQLNGKPYHKLFFNYEDFANGATVNFGLSEKPDIAYLTSLEKPVMKNNDELIVPSPSINISGTSRAFKGKQQITITDAQKDAVIYYTTDGSKPDQNSKRYTGPFDIDASMKIRAVAIKEGFAPSFRATANFHKIEGNYSIKLNAESNRTYTGGGNDALIDGLRGDADWRLGNLWQGYQGVNLDAVVDLGAVKKVNTVSLSALQDVIAWIMLPPKVTFLVSDDNVHFREVGTVKSPLDPRDYKAQVMEYTVEVNASCRYIKVVAEDFGKLPEWHLGAGGQSLTFYDEIIIK